MNTNEKIKGLMKQIADLDEQIVDLKERRISLSNQVAAEKILPFKEGDEVMYEVTTGRSRKLTKCLIEIDDGFPYVRPYKGDGSLSSRHFILADVAAIKKAE